MMYFVGRYIILIIGLDFSHESIIVNLLEFIMNSLHKSNLIKTLLFFSIKYKYYIPNIKHLLII